MPRNFPKRCDAKKKKKRALAAGDVLQVTPLCTRVWGHAVTLGHVSMERLTFRHKSLLKEFLI